MALEREPVLLISLDRSVSGSLHEQLEAHLRELVRSGNLPAGTKLPSSRALALQLGVSRGVVLEAYSQLSAEGYLAASQGAATRVAAAASIERPPVLASSFRARHAYDFDPASPDLSAFPRDRWLRSLRAVLRQAPFEVVGEGDPRGVPELRNELMSYLSRVRGAAPEPEHTLLTSGFTQGFAALCRVLRDRGVERVAVEDPGWSQHRLIAERIGLEPCPVAVDPLGIDVGELARSGCEVVVITPAHQFPTGAVLGAERRARLLEWAEDVDALIVEDDYDSELRYEREPVGALQGLAPERVAYVGSVSKRLAPALRIGWILSPSWLTGALTYEQAVSDGGSPALDQLALSDFIARGELDRHLRRMRLHYRARRQALLDALTQSLPRVKVSGVAAGLFAMVEVPGLRDEAALVRAAAEREVNVEASRTAGGDTALVLGFANLSTRAIADGIERLAEALRA